MTSVSGTLTLEERTARVLSHPYHRFAGLELVHQEPGKAWCRFEVNANSISLSATLHAGVLYGLLDATSYLALLPMLDPGEQAVTVDMHVSLIRSVPASARVALRAEVLRKRTGIAFVRCEAQTVEDAAGTVALATVTKVISRSA
jgi:acyl-coenzyme A thioesterase PaaI-like protein